MALIAHGCKQRISQSLLASSLLNLSHDTPVLPAVTGWKVVMAAQRLKKSKYFSSLNCGWLSLVDYNSEGFC